MTFNFEARLPKPEVFTGKLNNLSFNSFKPSGYIADLVKVANVHIKAHYNFIKPPKNCYRFLDAHATGKRYLTPESKLIRASHLPFEEDFIKPLVGKTPIDKAYVQTNLSGTIIPMLNDEGIVVNVISVYFMASGNGKALTLLPDGEIDTSRDQFMRRNMATGMERQVGSEFPVYSIPKENMNQKAEKFTYFENISD